MEGRGESGVTRDKRPEMTREERGRETKAWRLGRKRPHSYETRG